MSCKAYVKIKTWLNMTRYVSDFYVPDTVSDFGYLEVKNIKYVNNEAGILVSYSFFITATNHHTFNGLKQH